MKRLIVQDCISSAASITGHLDVWAAMSADEACDDPSEKYREGSHQVRDVQQVQDRLCDNRYIQ